MALFIVDALLERRGATGSSVAAAALRGGISDDGGVRQEALTERGGQKTHFGSALDKYDRNVSICSNDDS
jgi:hypothetical protein